MRFCATMQQCNHFGVKLLRACIVVRFRPMQYETTAFCIAYYIHLSGPGTITLPPLLSSLAVFTNLHSITLHDFKPPSPISPSTLPLLRSVRHLNLEQCWEDTIIIADCCPSLETLKFSLNRWPPQLSQSARRWPPLRRLTLADQLAGPIVHTGRVGTVHTLELGDVFTVSDIPPLPAVVPNGFEDIFEHVRHAISLIRTTHPSALRAAIRVNETGFNDRLGAPRPTVLGDIAVAAPKLRVLDLVLKPVKIQKWRDILVRTIVQFTKCSTRANPVARIARTP